MKKLLVSSMVSCLFISSCAFAKTSSRKVEKIVLESPLISLVDGKWFGVNGEVFGLMLKYRSKLREKTYGKMQADGQKIGFYEYEGQKVTLLDLCKIESQVEADSTLTKDEYNAEKRALEEILDLAKSDFIEIADQYGAGVRSIKEQLLGLIKVFVEKKGLDSCFLLVWGSIDADQEEEAIRSQLKTFKDFTRFYVELSDFLEVMANSCPKGKKQFIDLIKKARQGK